MERLTERYTETEKPDGESDVWVHNHDYIMASERLADYEDTGLTPQEIAELLTNEEVERYKQLKERDTAKAPVDTDDEFDMYVCPNCNMAIGTIGDKMAHKFCLNCGQKIRWED